MTELTATPMLDGEENFTSTEMELIRSDADYRSQLLRDLIGKMQENTRKIAVVVALMYEAGQEIALPSGAVAALLKIAHGQALPGIYTSFANNFSRCKQIACLPMPDQERLLKGGAIEVVVPVKDGSGYTHDLIEPRALRDCQWAQVLDENGLRDLKSQTAWLEAERTKKWMKKTRKAKVETDVRPDKRAGGVWFGGGFYDRATIADALAKIS